MLMSFPVRAVVVALVLAGLAGCSTKKTAIYEHESFDDSGTFSRNYPVTDKASCEAARRALLSQGYIITSSDPKIISGHKSFQQTGESHLEISFNVVCADDGGSQHHATMFANALQDRYALKKVNNSASLGVGVLGSVSMPIGSTDDSMVKVASETVSSPQFYDRFFGLVEVFLPKPKEVEKAPPVPEKPKPELGVPEPAPAKAETAAPAPAAEQATPSVPVVAPVSEPVLPAPAVTPVTPVAPVVPAPAPVTVTPEVKPAAELPEPAKPVTPAAEPASTPAPAAVEPSTGQ
ncbi:DUF2242 domain-containing protein [Pseudomonas fragi]|uniref:DUF2242 domain-containing protein n=1 Tax=Pseudomonas fragi TaxID=296 RepID=UPI0021C17F1D|nr:DUF2242 domain-containing protein [Pseudomonas fragi]UXL40376.1 DUF2242 domain-containing protein [Pseudomonas fragi]